MSWFLFFTEFAALAAMSYGTVFGLAKFMKIPAAVNLLEYIHRLLHGWKHMILSSESSGKAQGDADGIRDAKDKVTKTIVFFRHGESVWNEVFNRGFGPSFLGRLGKALLRELTLATQLDSVFFDTPLSKLGIEQAAKVLSELQKYKPGTDPKLDRIVSILKGESDEDIVVAVSNLRRAIQTAAVGLSLRQQKGKTEKYLIHSALQEMSRNVDTQSWLPAKQVPKYDFGVDFLKIDPEKLFDASLNSGNKSINSKGPIRQRDFLNWAFKQNQDVIIVVGHSLWFKNFFKNFLPQFSLHESKKNKIANCGIVTFEIAKAANKGQELYRIDQATIKPVVFGFDKKKK